MSNNQNDDNTQSFISLTTGIRVSHYEIISKIGAGGMGEVYLAEDTQLDRKVALKFLPPHLCQDEDCRARFTREAKAAAKLDHPNIVPVYEVGEFKDRPFFAMGYIEGKSLRDCIKVDKLTIQDAINIVKQICDGLQKAYEEGVVHRDIKPGNIIIDKENRVRILDFGLATVSGEEKLTKTGSTLGTVGYMSPEQIEGKQVDYRSDLFSVGVIFYEMITGRKPFEGESDIAVTRAITDTSPEPIARYKSGTSGELQQIIDKVLIKDPSLRYQHADDMAADLERLKLDTSPIRKVRPTLWYIIAALVIFVGGYYGISQYLKKIESHYSNTIRLLVLPFENLGDNEKDYFVSGITEEISTRLINIGGLAVIPRVTANRYAKMDKTMSQIGQELKADYIVDGTMRWQKNANGEERVRIGVHLIDVTQDASIWSKTYDTVITEVFSIQSDISENVTEQMGIKLNVIEKKQIWESYTTNQQAYDFYLRGRRFHTLHGGFGPLRDFQLAADMQEKAIALDSNFAEAHAYLSLDYSMQWDRGIHIDSIKSRAFEMVQKAIALKPKMKLGGWILARYYFHCEKNPQKALEILTETYKNDLSADTYLSQSQTFLRSMGKWEQAYQNRQKYIEENPQSIYSYYDQGQNCLYLRRYEEAEQIFDKVIEMQPDFESVYRLKVTLYLHWMGDIEKAKDVIQKSYSKIDSTIWRYYVKEFELWDGNPEPGLIDLTMPPLDSLTYYLNMGLLYYRINKTEIMSVFFDSALVHAKNYLRNNPDNPRPYYRLGYIYAGLGLKDEAIWNINKAVELAPYEESAFNNWIYLEIMLRIYVMLNEKDKALKQLEHMLSVHHYFNIPRVFIDPYYKPMLEYPGFDKIVDKYGNRYAQELWKKHLNKAN